MKYAMYVALGGAILGAALTAWLRSRYGGARVLAVGHRVVHGGPQYDKPTIVTPEVLADLRVLIPLAPLHQPFNLDAIEAVSELLPGVPQVACFDTSFHRGQPAVAEIVPLPREVCRGGVQRYGFHGLSYEYIASVLPTVAPELPRGRVIVAHLGSGASMCALSAGRSVESTMGFTALDGLPMGTRPGQLDPGVVLYLLQEKQMNAGQIQKLLYGECGLKGLSGISNDVRDLEGSADPQARFALDYFAYRVALNAGMMAAALGGLDGFVFTAGIGENSPSMRSRIVQKLALFGAVLDPDANAAGAGSIAAPTSRIDIRVVPTDEELMIARHTLAALTAQKAQPGSGARIR